MGKVLCNVCNNFMHLNWKDGDWEHYRCKNGHHARIVR